jgi:hypothetical protein
MLTTTPAHRGAGMLFQKHAGYSYPSQGDTNEDPVMGTLVKAFPI